MRLQQFVPPLDPSFVQALSEIGIKTDTDLLLTHDPLATFTKLPAGHGVTLKQYREVLAQVAGLAAATPTYGDKLLERETKRQEDIFSDVPDTMQLGVPAVDALVGGFAPPRVIEVSGDSGTGKTVRVCASDRYEADHLCNLEGTRSPARPSPPHSGRDIDRTLDRQQWRVLTRTCLQPPRTTQGTGKIEILPPRLPV